MSKKRNQRGPDKTSKPPKRLFKNRERPTVPDEPPVVGLAEYYQPSFYEILAEISRKRLFNDVSRFPERHTRGKIAPEPMGLRKAGSSLTRTLRRSTLSSNNGYQSSRSLTGCISSDGLPTAIGRDKSPATILLTRAALEAAIQKWGSAELCNRIADSDTIPPSAILKGRMLRLGGEPMKDFLRANRQLVLTDFDREEYIDALETEKLAYEAWRSMAMRRIVGKGANLVVGDCDEFVRDDRTEEFGRTRELRRSE